MTIANGDNAQAILDEMMRATLPKETEDNSYAHDSSAEMVVSEVAEPVSDKESEVQAPVESASECEGDATEKESDDQSRRVSEDKAYFQIQFFRSCC